MGLREDRVDIEALFGMVEDGTLDLGVPLDQPMPLEEFRARVHDRAESLFGTRRREHMIGVIHSLLWPEAGRRE
jgi:hypothetical protein